MLPKSTKVIATSNAIAVTTTTTKPAITMVDATTAFATKIVAANNTAIVVAVSVATTNTKTATIATKTATNATKTAVATKATNLASLSNAAR